MTDKIDEGFKKTLINKIPSGDLGKKMYQIVNFLSF